MDSKMHSFGDCSQICQTLVSHFPGARSWLHGSIWAGGLGIGVFPSHPSTVQGHPDTQLAMPHTLKQHMCRLHVCLAVGSCGSRMSLPWGVQSGSQWRTDVGWWWRWAMLGPPGGTRFPGGTSGECQRFWTGLFCWWGGRGAKGGIGPQVPETHSTSLVAPPLWGHLKPPCAA